MNKEEVLEFEKKGYYLDNEILKTQEEIRQSSSKLFDSNLINSRILIASLFYELLNIKNSIPGKTDKTKSKILNLIATFIQGFNISENLIFDGQYTKAAAILKQDYEILTRINELKKSSNSIEGKTPNVKFAPNGSQRIYGKLNEISHPSNSDIIKSLVDKSFFQNISAVSPLPVFNKILSEHLYKTHIYICFEILKENILLMTDLYGNEIIDELDKNRYFEYFELLYESLIKGNVIVKKSAANNGYK